MKRLIVALSAILLMASIKHQPSLNEVIDRAKQSLVGITIKSPDDETYFCSGTVVAEHYVLTAAHCTGQYIYILNGEAVSPLAIDAAQDLAVFWVSSTKPALTLRTTALQRFETIYQLGYAFHAHEAYIIKGDVFLTSYDDEGNGVFRFYFQGDALHGMSGGPVIDRQGLLVGIVQEGRENVGDDVVAEAIKAFLTNTGVLY